MYIEGKAYTNRFLRDLGFIIEIKKDTNFKNINYIVELGAGIGLLASIFLKLNKTKKLTNKLSDVIKKTIKTSLSPRHVPSLIFQVEDIPYTISGKKVELAVKKIIEGDHVVNQDALSNPESLDLYRSILK